MALDVVVMSIVGTACEDKFGTMATLGFQCVISAIARW